MQQTAKQSLRQIVDTTNEQGTKKKLETTARKEDSGRPRKITSLN